jgi:hypothetical protein
MIWLLIMICFSIATMLLLSLTAKRCGFVYYQNAQYLYKHECDQRNILSRPLSMDVPLLQKVSCIYIASHISCLHKGDPLIPPHLLDVLHTVSIV